jgi:lipopolysaccharide transport system permease protein/teichoic acid transport system permease protein
MIFWFIFSVGFKVTGPSEIPFLLYFVTGYAPWLMFSEVLMISTNGARGNLVLIKKTNFPSEVLPFVYMGTASITHAIFLIIILMLMFFYSVPFSFYMVQVFYYYMVLCFFLIGLCWILSAANVFHRDVGQAIGIIINFWFWLTPIVWVKEIIPSNYQWLIFINPMTYIIEGYRKSLLYQESLFLDFPVTIYFLSLSALSFVMGALIYKRLKLEFADAI